VPDSQPIAETQLPDVPVEEGHVDTPVNKVTIEVAARIADHIRDKVQEPCLRGEGDEGCT
jgi:hypothetical protein